MNFKRTVGTGKIFLYSCGIVTALAAAVWLIINGVYAVYISGKGPKWRWFGSYTESAADIVTPWLLMAAAMAIYYRYWKMCSANNVSCTKQTAMFSLLSVFVPAAFAAADLLYAKLVLQPLYGGIIITRLEDESIYFYHIITDYMDLFEENVPQTLSPYTMKTLLLIFVFMTLYYYSFFLAGCYIMQCFRYGRKELIIYYSVTTAILILTALVLDKLDPVFEDSAIALILLFIFVAAIASGFLTNPFIFLYFIPYLTGSGIDSIIVCLIMLTVFILITVVTIEVIGLGQFPRKREIKKALKNYNTQNNHGEGGTLNGQT